MPRRPNRTRANVASSSATTCSTPTGRTSRGSVSLRTPSGQGAACSAVNRSSGVGPRILSIGSIIFATRLCTTLKRTSTRSCRFTRASSAHRAERRSPARWNIILPTVMWARSPTRRANALEMVNRRYHSIGWCRAISTSTSPLGASFAFPSRYAARREACVQFRAMELSRD